MGWNYTPDHHGTGEYLRNEPALRAELERRGHLGLAVADSLSPFRTGKLRASGHVTYNGRGGIHKDRMEVEVVFDVDYAAAATYPPGPDERAYLVAAKAAMEAG